MKSSSPPTASSSCTPIGGDNHRPSSKAGSTASSDQGVAYRFEEEDNGEGIPIGLLKARLALILNTSNTPTPREQKVFGDPLETLWKMCIFDLCGVSHVHRRMFNIICTSTMAQREKWLAEAVALTEELFPNSGVGG